MENGGPGEIIEWEMQYKSIENPEFEFSERVLDLGEKKKWLKGTPILYAINEFQTLEEAQLYRATADL